MKTNYHTHTTRCMHAVGDDEDYVRSDIKGGFKELGFSDHGPWKYHTDFVSDIRMLPEDLPEYIQEELSELQSYFGSIEELCEHEDDIICHSGCDDMADVARCYLEESGQLGELPAHLQNYIDYAAYGRDMELEGTFVVTNHGVYEILR